MLNVFRTKKANGKTHFALLDEKHFPGIERALFIHSLSESATSSIERNVNDLKFFLESMKCLGIDVDSLGSSVICADTVTVKQKSNIDRAMGFTQ